jgi:CBS domain containing-hemolysin-like protein
MPDEDRSSDSGVSLFGSLRALLFGDGEASLRERLEEAIEEEAGERLGPDDLSPVERQMLLNLLHFGEKGAAEVAVTRGDIIAFDLERSFADLVELFVEAGHSRIPVYRGELDKIVGMVHVKDVYAHLAKTPVAPGPPALDALVRPVLFVPESMGVLDLLARMRSERTHLAIVVDEFGGTDGLVTIEDIVEEIVGEIEDEYDETPKGLISSLPDGLFEADARAPLDELAAEVDVRLIVGEDEVDTLGGLVILLAGRVPEVGEVIEHPSGWRLETIAGDARRVERLRLHPPPVGVLVEE